jgi:hypothetical protein
MMLSREARFTNVIQEYSHFKKILNISSPQAKNFLNSAFMTTEMSNSINQLLWVPGQKMFVFGSRSSLLSEEHIIRKYNKKTERIEREPQNRMTSVKGLRTFIPGNDIKTMRKFVGV